MKLRNGFVSNSSSSVFLIDLERLTDEQINLIIDHPAEQGQGWKITIEDKRLIGGTIMDNFDFGEYLASIGVKNGEIEWITSYEDTYEYFVKGLLI